MRIISVKLPPTYVEKMDQMIKEGRFTSRSEIIRFALLDLFRKEEEYNNLKGRVKTMIGP